VAILITYGLRCVPCDNSTAKGAGRVQAAAIDRDHYQMPQENRDSDGQGSKCLQKPNHGVKVRGTNPGQH
jgi:hypothetical protein